MTLLSSFLPLYIFIFHVNIAIAFGNLPKIDFNGTEHVLEAGDNFTIICEGNKRLKWIYPQIKGTATNISTFNIEPEYSEDYKFALELEIKNITFQHVGFYTCSEENDSTRNDRIYLYVNDKQHLSVENRETDVIMDIHGIENTEIIIPCRPTSPYVKVSLFSVFGVRVKMNSTDDGEDDDPIFQFDLQRGFISQSISSSSLYTCKFKRAGIRQQYTVHVIVEVMTDFLAEPTIEVVEHGGYGGTVILKCQVRTDVDTEVHWKLLQKKNERLSISYNKNGRNDVTMVESTLEIINATLEDKGDYWCIANDYQNHTSETKHYLKIHGPHEHFINFTLMNFSKSAVYNIGSMMHWEIGVDAFPETQFSWINNRNKNLSTESSNKKYQWGISENNAFLIIKNISYTDYGEYKLIGKNKFDTEKLTLLLNVQGKPQIVLKVSSEYQMTDGKSFVKCIVTSHSKPQIQLEFKPCINSSCEYKNIRSAIIQTNGNEFSMNVSKNFASLGTLRCRANNSFGYVEVQKELYVSDIEEGFDIFQFNEEIINDKKKNEVIVARNGSITVTCGAFHRNKTQSIKWMRGNSTIQMDKKHLLESNNTKYSKRIRLTIRDLNFDDQNTYTCYHCVGNILEKKSFSLLVSNPSIPRLISTNTNGTVEINFGESTELRCVFTGLPKPFIKWYKDNDLYNDFKNSIDNENVNLTITSIIPKKEGTYRCEGKNKYNKASKDISVVFKTKSSNRIHTVVIIIFGVVIIAAFIMIYIKDSRKKKLEKVLRDAGLAYFEKGQIENLNPELGIEDQAELLPFDKSWEFPINNLKLGKQLGAGAFGVVVKGQAKGISPGEEITTVAVKMVKRTADHTFVKALASELKIMSHLGKHVNVVNLLGACTKNVARRELFVIVEYCKFGNIHNYLYRHRKDFINQIDPEMGTVDFSIGMEKLERSYSVASDRSYIPMKYAAQFSIRSNSIRSVEGYKQQNDQGSSAGIGSNSAQVSLSPRTEQEEEMLLSNCSAVEPEWGTNYKGDYKGTVKPISTSDLLIWSFQVARGMEYLASRKVLHGDLAARNILLADDNIVKICDFGLAKNMYKNDNYKKKSDSPLPIKWMAIESIRDRVFSTQSDVWSFGIVLWELFSLARTPYPGMEADEKLYAKLVDGYRMEAPKYSNNDIYQLMLDCWSKKPLNRPSFTQLAEKLGKFLEDNVTQHYIDLNDPYLSINVERFGDGGNDYLAMLNTPNFENLSSPSFYVNDFDSNYTRMRSPQIINEGRNEPNVFTFDDANRRKYSADENRDIENKNEEIELELSNFRVETVPACSFSNPSYSIPPIRSADEENNVSNQNISIKTEERDGDVEKMEGASEIHYINSCSRDWEKDIA